MNSRPTQFSRSGFIIQEVIVAIVVFGIAVIPIVRGLRMVSELASAMGEQSRKRAWRSALEESIATGTNPVAANVLSDVAQSVDQISGKVGTSPLTAHVGAAQIAVIHESFEEMAEARSVSAGIRIGRSALVVPPRVDPLPPLPPIKIAAPGLSPASGTLIGLPNFAPPPTAGSAYVTNISSTAASPSNVVRISATAPIPRQNTGIGVATTTLDAVELAHSVRGQTWAEYRGGDTDVGVDLGDGRMEWFVDVDGRTQIFEPSDFVPFVYGIDIGRPSFAMGAAEFASGASVPVDLADAERIESGDEIASLTYPAEVRSLFGASWGSVAPTFAWGFGSSRVAYHSTNARAIFTAENRSFWQESQTLVAAPESDLAGLRLLNGSWTIQRVPLELQPPQRVAQFYFGATDELGYLDFSAPLLERINRRAGRPQVGSVESVGETLSVLVIP